MDSQTLVLPSRDGWAMLVAWRERWAAAQTGRLPRMGSRACIDVCSKPSVGWIYEHDGT